MNRRNLLKFLGGSALGTLLTPIPWKVLDDVAIWTQNWSWIPVPAGGEKQVRYTNCALCPAGCGLQALCAGDQPIALTGLLSHPASRGFACPAGISAHQLPYDPDRLTSPLKQIRKNGTLSCLPTTTDEVLGETSSLLAEMRDSSAEGLVAILDACPGRSTSLAYQAFAARIPNGRYLSIPDPASDGLRVMSQLAGWTAPGEEAGVDLEQARTILSFGAGLHEGWGTPGRFFHLLRSSAERPRLIQVETRQSTTALMADRWLPVKPGSESALALGLAFVILEQKLYDEKAAGISELLADSSWQASIAEFTPSRVAKITGLSEETVVSTAKEITSAAPCLVISGRDHATGAFAQPEQVAIQALNLLLGNIEREGGVVGRRALPAPAALAADQRPVDRLALLPDGSIRLLIIDAATPRRPAVPPADLLRKLHPERSLVVCLSPSRDGYARLADYVLPTPGFLECLDEIPTAPDSPVATLSLSLPLLQPPAGVVEPLGFLSGLAEKSGVVWQAPRTDELLDARVQAIWEASRGSVSIPADGSSKEIGEFATARDLSEALRAGGCWQDARRPVGSRPVRGASANRAAWESLRMLAFEKSTAAVTLHYPLFLIPFGTSFMAAPSPLLTTKLTRESRLYADSSEALVNPATAAEFGMRAGKRIRVETARGSLEVRVRTDEGARPGIVFVPAFSFASKANHTCSGIGQGSARLNTILEVRDICTTGKDGIWRPTPARVWRLDV
jgi:menaquinone reductase, molybdopterin-binding-like subunit